jgi:DNA-binding transcriptional MerR regulator
MLQADAAGTAGCSVSAIRKWRRAGLVADRTRVSQGGLRRVEVSLEDVIARMRESMGGPRFTNTSAAHAAAAPAAAPISANDIEVFLQHITEAERRAAQAEARMHANEAMMEFLRDRVSELQAQLELEQSDPAPHRMGPHLDGQRLATEIRALRKRLESYRQGAVKPTADERLATRAAHDGAVLCLCIALAIPSRVQLGGSLTAAERARLTEALAKAGFDIVG